MEPAGAVDTRSLAGRVAAESGSGWEIKPGQMAQIIRRSEAFALVIVNNRQRRWAKGLRGLAGLREGFPCGACGTTVDRQASAAPLSKTRGLWAKPRSPQRVPYSPAPPQQRNQSSSELEFFQMTRGATGASGLSFSCRGPYECALLRRSRAVGGCWGMLKGGWEVGGGRWEVGGGRWEVGGGRWEVGGGRWEVGGGRWEVGGGRWEVGGGRWEVGGGKGGPQQPSSTLTPAATPKWEPQKEGGA